MGAGGMELIVFEEPAELPEFEDTVRYLAAVKATLTPEHYCNFLGIMDTFRKQGFDYDWLKANLKECLEEFRYLTKCFNVFLPEPHRIEVPPPESVWIEVPTARRFLYKIKRCLTGSDQILDSFLHILQNFGENGKSVLEFYRELVDFALVIAGVWTIEVLMICNKVKEQLSADDSKKFLDYLKNYSKGRLSSNDLHYLVGNLLADKPALFEEFKDCATCLAKSHNKPCRKKGNNGRFIRKGASGDDKLVKDLNLSRCFRVTPSYRLVPESYINPEASEKSEAEQQVLNYRLLCVPSGNGDFRNAPSRSNPYANKLYKCEDEMYEIDMLIENGSSVISRINRLQKKINDPGSNIKIPIRLEDHFKARNLRCIAQVYGDQASEVTAALSEHPHRSLPVLLDRMNKQKHKWVNGRKDYLPIWDEVIRQNYHKSLDPQSFTKKQNSKKTNGKALILAGSKEFKFNDKKAALPNFTISYKIFYLGVKKEEKLHQGQNIICLKKISKKGLTPVKLVKVGSTSRFNNM
ncbi:hypothetical protein QQ045_019961 [Rhodiola kirilowii]